MHPSKAKNWGAVIKYAESIRDGKKIACEEGFKDIAGLYKNVRQVENCHRLLFQDLYQQMKSGTLYKKDHVVKWKCSGCGYEEEGKEAFQICPLCQAKQGEVMLKLNDNA